jgi:zinc transport system ATP-binding protein
MPKQLLVSCKAITCKKGNQTILKDINLDIHRGDVVTIIGPNGGGKTTLAKIIAGVEKEYKGTVTRSGDIQIGYMPQKINFNPLIPITVKDFLALNFESKDHFAEKAQSIIKRNKIHNILNRQLHDVSGGELQRIMLSIALLKDPDLLVLDEPTQALDITGQYAFYSFIEEIKKNESKTMIIISHDLHTVMRATDKVICLNKIICCSGVPEYVKGSSAYKKLFFTKGDDSIAYYTHRDRKKVKQ